MADWQSLARRAARQAGVPPNLFVALVRQESGGRQGAVSGSGAIGYTQLLPGTARGLGVNPYNPWQNLVGGARYLRQQLNRFGNINEALAAYNAGPGAVERYGGIPPYAETRNYVRSIRAMAGQIGLGGSGARGGGQPRGTRPFVPGAPISFGGADAPNLSGLNIDSSSGVNVASLLSALQGQKSAPQSAPLQAPSFAAGPTLPQGYQSLASSGAPQKGPDVQQLLSLVQTPGIDLTPGSAASTSGVNGAMSPAGAPLAPVQGVRGSRTPAGRVTVTAGANRAGVGIQRPVLNFARQVAGIYGKPLAIGTGTNHNQFVIGTNRQSDHWTGNAVDIPSSGQALTRLGQDALIAAGWSPARARRQTGGLFNVELGGRRVQIIFNSNIGGNHYNHLHLGVR